MKNKLNEKVAVITGASSGIGYAIAQRLYSKGVIVYDISKLLVEHNEIKAGYEADVNDTEKVDEILKKFMKRKTYWYFYK